MIYDPNEDGVTHINVYSKGRTTLGRELSNFALSPFRLPFLGNFLSGEGFWFWWMTGNEKLRKAYGWQAKKLGQSLPLVRPHPDVRLLKLVYRAKLRSQPILKELLQANKLPLAHYYVYGGKVVVPKDWQWTVKLWEEFR